ncbi:ArsC/Spx/MgsR family protein (plasmid) [Lactiplantibacillus plantarum]|nr:ArsC/Spx/MgsR family protein [Lactiplantibacillus plantarum]
MDLPLNTALQILCDYPKLLRRPIIVSNTKLQIGFNEDEIRKFIPRSIRRLECDDLLKQLEPPQI